MIIEENEPLDLVKRSIGSVIDGTDGAFITITYKEKEPTTSPLIEYLRSIHTNLTFFKWTYSFADARNFALEQMPKGKNIYLYWQDADDVNDNAGSMHAVTEWMLENNIAATFFPYLYMIEQNPDGSIHEVLIEHKRERLVRNDGTFKWIGMLHETLIEQRSENIIKTQRNDFNIIHLSEQSRFDANIERNVKILEKQAGKEQHKDPRTILYLAKAYVDKGKMAKTPTDRKIFFDLAFTLFTEYLEGSGKVGEEGTTEGSGWPEERATAWEYVSDICQMNDQLNMAIKALCNAIVEAPVYPIFYVKMAMVYTLKKDYQKARHWLNLATHVPQPDTTLITTPRDMKVLALEVDYNICLAEGKLEKSVQDSKFLCEIMPGSVQFKERLAIVEGLLAENKAAQSVVYLGKYLEEGKELTKIPSLVNAIPSVLQDQQFASQMRHKFLPAKIWKENEIAILAGPGFETWSDKSIDSGLGGSEEAIVYLSKELVKLGWKITVYANPGIDEGQRDGVYWKNWYDLNVKDRFNVLILWRGVSFVDFNPRAQFVMLWNHDMPSNTEFTEERINKIDKLAVLSEYHKEQFRMQKPDGSFVKIPEDKFFLTGNGINI